MAICHAVNVVGRERRHRPVAVAEQEGEENGTANESANCGIPFAELYV